VVELRGGSHPGVGVSVRISTVESIPCFNPTTVFRLSPLRLGASGTASKTCGKRSGNHSAERWGRAGKISILRRLRCHLIEDVRRRVWRGGRLADGSAQLVRRGKRSPEEVDHRIHVRPLRLQQAKSSEKNKSMLEETLSNKLAVISHKRADPLTAKTEALVNREVSCRGHNGECYEDVLREVIHLKTVDDRTRCGTKREKVGHDIVTCRVLNMSRELAQEGKNKGHI